MLAIGGKLSRKGESPVRNVPPVRIDPNGRNNYVNPIKSSSLFGRSRTCRQVDEKESSLILKAFDHREVWKVSEDHILSIIIYITPRFFMWVGFILAVGALQTINHIINTGFTSVLYYISSGLLGAYTYIVLLTIGRFFVQRGLDRIQQVDHRVAWFISFLSIVFTAILVALLLTELSNQLKLVVAAIE